MKVGANLGMIFNICRKPILDARYSYFPTNNYNQS